MRVKKVGQHRCVLRARKSAEERQRRNLGPAQKDVKDGGLDSLKRGKDLDGPPRAPTAPHGGSYKAERMDIGQSGNLKKRFG